MIGHTALFSKTYRIMERSSMLVRINVHVTDVMGVFAIIIICNATVLILWTVLDPLTYARSWDAGTDYWNREFSSSGACACKTPSAYLVPLGISKYRVCQL